MSIFDIFRNKNDPNTSKPVWATSPNPQPVSPAAPNTSPPQSTIAPITAPPKIESTCPAPGVYGAVDLCTYVTQHFLDVMRYLGVKTIVRYYEYANETIHGKTPTAAELTLIKKNGFKMMAVFQHSNNSVATFEIAGRGAKDAARSLELAAEWKQPNGSAIYFGVDFDASEADLDHVKVYAKQFGDAVRAAGYRVGAYGSGLTLETLLAAKLIDLAWLSMATGHRDSKAFATTNKWVLHQVKDRDCGGLNIDFNYVCASGDIGDWKIP